MSDLINRKAVMKFLSDKNKDGMPESATAKAVYCFIENLIDEIRDEIPTAYDVDKVAIEISDYFQSYIRNCNLTEEDALTILYMEEHITKLVKGAVKDE